MGSAVVNVAEERPDVASSAAARDRGSRGAIAISLGLRLLSIGPLLILIVLAAAISLLTPDFLKPGNLGNIVAQTAVIAIVAMGQHLVILTRGIDLSVGANLALATVIGGLVFRQIDSAPLVMLAMILSGAAVGAINGIAFVYGRLPHAFIITLATLSICRGLALELAVGHTTMRGMPEAIAVIGGSSSLGIPNSFFVVLGVAMLVLLMTKAMVWGRWIYAVGGQPEAALEMGIPVKGVLVSTYVISGLCAGIGAVLLAGRVQVRLNCLRSVSFSSASSPCLSAAKGSCSPCWRWEPHRYGDSSRSRRRCWKARRRRSTTGCSARCATCRA